MSWFEVDRDGLRQLLEGRNKSFIIRELVQNAWDESGVTRCDVTLEPIKGNRKARLVVEDDAPEGFYDLSHAYTLYAHTRKRSSPNKRGRFNIGEKQVLALCHSAKITTTKGTVEFLANGKRKQAKACRDSGSVFEAVLPMAKAEIEDCAKAVCSFIPPAGIRTTFNGEEIRRREPLATVEAKLPTEVEDEEGRYKPTIRKTGILVYEPLPDEKAMIYEMGLPVIETGDRWHYDIQQRIPLTSDRDHVRSAFLQDVRAEVANVMVSQITDEDASAEWIRDASADDRVKPETLNTIAELRWGEKRTVAFPGDSDGRDKAIAAGYHLVAPTEMNADEWEQMRKAGCVPAVSALFPQPKVPEKTVPKSRWTPDQVKVAELAGRIARLTLGIGVAPAFRRGEGEQKKQKMVTLRVPRKAWELLAETLAMDARSKAFDPDLRRRVGKALDEVREAADPCVLATACSGVLDKAEVFWDQEEALKVAKKEAEGLREDYDVLSLTQAEEILYSWPSNA